MIRVRGAPGSGRDRADGGAFGWSWEVALVRVALHEGTEYGEACASLFRHIDAGWALIRPLSVARVQGPPSAGNQEVRGRAAVSISDHLLAFAEMEVIDAYRWLAMSCADYVTGAVGSDAPTLDDLLGEGERCVRALYVLSLATTHPMAPEELRRSAADGAEILRWLDDFEAVFTRFARLIDEMMEESADGGVSRSILS